MKNANINIEINSIMSYLPAIYESISTEAKNPPLLEFVMNGDAKAAEKYIENLKIAQPDNYYQMLLQAYPTVEKHNNRHWEAISPIEFAAYAGDFSENPDQEYMLNILLKHLPDEHKHRALNQIKHIKDHGTNQFGQVRNILSALTKLDECYENYDENFKHRTPTERDYYWKHVIGSAQRNLPVYALQEFCRPISWQPTPDFNTLPAPPRAAKLADHSTLLPMEADGLGENWALYHFGWTASAPTRNCTGITARFNRTVLRDLYQTKLAQLDTIINQLS